MTTPRVTVPVEPTEAMMKAADAVDWNNEDERASVINMWQAMLSAAPAPEVGAVRAWMFRESPSERWHVTMDRRSVDEYLKAFSTAEVHPLAQAARPVASMNSLTGPPRTRPL